MTNRKGELSPAAVDRGWPHQVALPEDRCTGKQFDNHRTFCRDLSLCVRGHSVRHNDISYRVFCFGTAQDATLFSETFGGVPFYPEDRGRGARWMVWNRPLHDIRRPSKSGRLSASDAI